MALVSLAGPTTVCISGSTNFEGPTSFDMNLMIRMSTSARFQRAGVLLITAFLVTAN